MAEADQNTLPEPPPMYDTFEDAFWGEIGRAPGDSAVQQYKDSGLSLEDYTNRLNLSVAGQKYDPSNTVGGSITDLAGAEAVLADQMRGDILPGAKTTASTLTGDETGVNIGTSTGQLTGDAAATAKTATAPADIVAPTVKEGGYSAAVTAGAEDAVSATDLTAKTLTGAGISDEVRITDTTGTVSNKSAAVAAQGTASAESLVTNQLSQLYKDLERGQIPPWASGAMRGAAAVMAQRGLGKSSMASAAITQAVMESALPIAAADAATYAKLDLANLNNRQQAVLQNASVYAQMDLANLDAKMTAAVQNAKSFLSIDLANLNNEQAVALTEYESLVQAIFTDQAAENAMAQFNTGLQADVDQFYDQLGVQVAESNANREAAIAQFNADQENAVSMFNAEVKNSRDQFNANMSYQIAESNALWRREVNLSNTAAQNRANEVNSQRIYNASQESLATVWQEWSDEASWNRDQIANAEARAHDITLQAMANDATMTSSEMKLWAEAAAGIGGVIYDGISEIVGGDEEEE